MVPTFSPGCFYQRVELILTLVGIIVKVRTKLTVVIELAVLR